MSSDIIQLDPSLLKAAYTGGNAEDALNSFVRGRELQEVLKQRKMKQLQDETAIKKMVADAKAQSVRQEAIERLPRLLTPKTSQTPAAETQLPSLTLGQTTPTRELPTGEVVPDLTAHSTVQEVEEARPAALQETVAQAYPEKFVESIFDQEKERTKLSITDAPMSDVEYALADAAYTRLPENKGKHLDRNTPRGVADKWIRSQIGSENVGLRERGIDVSEQRLNMAGKNRMYDDIYKATSRPIVKGAVDALAGARVIKANLDNPIFLDRSGGLFQKLIARDSGNLAAWEQRKASSPQLWEKFMNSLSIAAAGKMSTLTRQQVEELLSVIEDNAKIDIELSTQSDASRIAQHYGVPPETVIKGMALEGYTGKTIGGLDPEKEKRYQELMLKKQQGTLR